MKSRGETPVSKAPSKLFVKLRFALESTLVNSVVALKREEFNSLDENLGNISWKQRFTIEPTFRISSYVPQITL